MSATPKHSLSFTQPLSSLGEVRAALRLSTFSRVHQAI